MNKSLHPALVAVVVVLLVAVVGGAIYYFSNPHTPAGFNYQPGVPPWKVPGAKAYSPNGNYGPKHHASQGPATPPTTQSGS